MLRRVAERRTPFQAIALFDTADFGRCLVIDDAMQASSLDHLLYDDTILARLRPSDRHVLVLGGGDGFVTCRALEKNPALHLTVVDIDPEVVELAEAHLNPGFSSHPRVALHVGDGLAFARVQPRGAFDGVVLDLTDTPVDAEQSRDTMRLFDEIISAVLPLIRPGGWLSMQAGPSVVTDGPIAPAELIRDLLKPRLADLVREDVFLPSYAEKNAFFHGVATGRPSALATEVNWRDHTVGAGLATGLALESVHSRDTDSRDTDSRDTDSRDTDSRDTDSRDTHSGRIDVLDHTRLGRALVIDGSLQHIDQDPSWRELLVHVPLLGGERPLRSVLLVGGADGIVLAEVLRHAFVERVTVWDDTIGLSEIGRTYLGTSAALDDARLTLVVEAAAVSGPFDLIVIARPDLRHPGDTTALGVQLASWLDPEGVLVDADAVVLDRHGTRWYREAPGAGPSLRTSTGLTRQGRYFGTGPVVPGGFVVFTLYGRAARDAARPRSAFEGRHYNADLHAAAFVLPRFIRELP